MRSVWLCCSPHPVLAVIWNAVLIGLNVRRGTSCRSARAQQHGPAAVFSLQTFSAPQA